MGKHVALSEAKPGVALWTPWGEQQALRPGEKFAALRRLAKHADRLTTDDKRTPARLHAESGS